MNLSEVPLKANDIYCRSSHHSEIILTALNSGLPRYSQINQGNLLIDINWICALPNSFLNSFSRITINI